MDPFVFFETFPVDQSLAVVGNSGSLAGWRMGQEIDRRDVVIRFNECRLRTFAVQVGERTDLLITNPYVEGREKTIGVEINPKMAVVIFPPTSRLAKGVAGMVEQYACMCYFRTAASRVPDVPPDLSISTGTYGIYLAIRLLKPSVMLITGFSMFDNRYAPYYWSHQIPPGVVKHDFPREAPVFARVPQFIEPSNRDHTRDSGHFPVHPCSNEQPYSSDQPRAPNRARLG